MEHESNGPQRTPVNIPGKEERQSEEQPETQNITDQHLLPEEESEKMQDSERHEKKGQNPPAGPQ
jgi:hypothetical protein